MSNFYAAASALIFALVALAHLVRLYKPVDSADWAIQGIHECIVGCPCRFCADRNLGLYAITAVVAARRSGWTAQRLAITSPSQDQWLALTAPSSSPAAMQYLQCDFGPLMAALFIA